MATNKSTEKILEFIERQEEPITKTQIVNDCVLPSSSVSECLRLLEKFGKIEIITNGKVMLIRRINENANK